MQIKNDKEVTLVMKGIDATIIYEALEDMMWKYAPLGYTNEYRNNKLEHFPKGKKGKQVLSTYKYIERQLEKYKNYDTNYKQ